MNFDKVINILVVTLLAVAIGALAAVLLHPICIMFPL